MIKASICTIGDEIIIGQVVDTNSSKIATRLEEAGISVVSMCSVRDNADQIRETVSRELSLCDVVITTGGLGPTKDDITKGVFASLTGSSAYVTHPGQLEVVKRILKGRGLDALPENLAQAAVPDTADVIVNEAGTAPIMVFRKVNGGGTLYALPGVPHESNAAIPAVLKDILTNSARRPSSIIHRNIMVYGIAESALSSLLNDWEDALPSSVHLAYLPNTLTGIRLRLSATADDDASSEVHSLLDRIADSLKQKLGNLVYSMEDDTLENTVGRLLKSKKLTLSTAESCTGGEISHLITSVQGSSLYFLGSVTSYAVSVKENVLGVRAETIDRFGVVSSQVAAEMADGVRRITGSDFAVSTTGLAGPGGDGTNPVGTVWIGVSGPLGTRTVSYCYSNDRQRNIERFAASALNFLRLYLEDI